MFFGCPAKLHLDDCCKCMMHTIGLTIGPRVHGQVQNGSGLVRAALEQLSFMQESTECFPYGE